MSVTPTTVVVCPNCGQKNRVPAVAHGKPQCSNCHHPLPWVVEADDSTFNAVADQADHSGARGPLGAVVRPVPDGEPGARVAGAAAVQVASSS